MVTNAFQDQHGLIYLATNNGLNTFDGYQFRIYHKGSNPGDLASNIVNAFAQGKDGTVYIALDNGLQYVKRGRFEPVKLSDGQDVKGNFRRICVTPNGELITGASFHSGLLRISGPGKAEWLNIKDRLLGSPRQIVFGHNLLWVVTEDHGVIGLQRNGKSWKSVMHLFTQGDLAGGISDVCIGTQGRIYAGSMKGGVYECTTGTAQRESHVIPGTEQLLVASLMTHKDGTILIGTEGKGLWVYNPVSKAVHQAQLFNNEININKVKVSSITSDREGNLWLSMLQKGVLMIPSKRSGFHYQGHRLGYFNSIGEASVGSVYQTADGTIWAGPDGDGLYALRPDGSLIKHYAPTCGVNSFPSAIMCMAEDHQNRLWIGAYMNGCGWIDRQNGTYHRLPCSYGRAQNVFDLIEDRQGRLWIATLGDGLKSMDLKTGSIKEYHSREGEGNWMRNDYISQLTLSPNGQRLYVCTSTGLSCLDLKTMKWNTTLGTNALLSEMPIVDAKEDQKGNVWICTNVGLYVFDKKSKQLTHLTTANGLSDNNVASVQIDLKDRVWVTTLHGMSCITSKKAPYVIQNYYLADGLQGNEFSWGVSFAGYKPLSTGAKGSSRMTLYFGGMDGLTWFTPDSINHQCDMPKLFITGLTVAGKEVRPGDESGWFTITQEAIDSTEMFCLSHQDNSFDISLSTLTYSNTERLTFAYSINGDEWIQLPQGKNTISMAHMQPGHYTFRVKAIAGGVESEVREFSVLVHNPWYFSLWAKLFYLILLICAVRWYLNQLRRKQQEQLRVQEHIHSLELRNQEVLARVESDKVDDVKLLSPDDKLMQRIMTVINKNLSDEELSVNFIATEVGISRVHLYRKMKELINQTPHEFIRNIRLKQAANLLSSGRHNITEVMNACGFSNAASFSTQFKKMYGLSPRDYMKENSSSKE